MRYRPVFLRRQLSSFAFWYSPILGGLAAVGLLGVRVPDLSAGHHAIDSAGHARHMDLATASRAAFDRAVEVIDRVFACLLPFVGGRAFVQDPINRGSRDSGDTLDLDLRAASSSQAMNLRNLRWLDSIAAWC